MTFVVGFLSNLAVAERQTVPCRPVASCHLDRMKMLRLAIVALLALLGHVSSTNYDDGLRRFEYKHSFKGPTLADKEGRIPCWTYGNSAMASGDQLRLTPSIRSRMGHAWNKFLFEKEWWEVEMVFRVTGRGRVGADGLAAWFTEKQGGDGPVFGSSDHWHGLGVFFDSFDNDGGQNNPHILLVQNDGTMAYDHALDGSTQALGGCMRDFRNRPHPPRALITYYKNELTLSVDHGSSPQPSYEVCARAVGIKLPPKGYFGLSAATGGLADDHDVLSFKVSSITAPSLPDKIPESPPAYNPDDFKQYEDEYAKRSEELNEQKDKFYKQHPEKRKPDDLADWETEYEDPTDRKLRLILEGQSAVQEQVKVLVRHVSTKAVQPAGGQPGQGQPEQHGISATDSAILSDLQSKLLEISREQMVSAQLLKEMQARRVDSPDGATGGAQQPGAAAQGVDELRSDVAVLKSSVDAAVQLMEGMKATSQAGSSNGAFDTGCVSTSTFLAASLGQLLLVVITVFIYSRQRASQEKRKFF